MMVIFRLIGTIGTMNTVGNFRWVQDMAPCRAYKTREGKIMKEVKINGEWFEVIRPRKYKPEYAVPSKWDYLNIYQAYERPSSSKVAIWKYWNSFYGDDVYKFGIPFIRSRNCFAFTVVFNVFDNSTYEWIGVAVITKDHNRLYLA